MIIVTKLQDGKDNKSENKFNIMKQTKELNRFKRNSITTFDRDIKTNNLDTIKDLINKFNNSKESDTYDIPGLLLLSYPSLESFVVSNFQQDSFNGISSLYKYDDKYFVILQNDISKSYSDLGNIETIISEYGEKHISTAISKYFLIEHGEKLIENKAVQLLSTVF